MSDHLLRTLDDVGDIRGRRVLVRVDFNVPVDAKSGLVSDDTRIVGALDTIGELRDKGARIILMSHRGRPKGWGGASLEVAALRLQELLGVPVQFVDDITGAKAQEAADQLKSGDILVLQNLRYNPGEKGQDEAFAQQLAQLGDLYVNDAFGTMHRSDASVALLPKFLPGYAGRLVAKELTVLGDLVKHAEHPYWAIIGGAKVSDKVGLLAALLEKVDGLVVGGGMANTFLVAQGLSMGASKVESEAVDTAKGLLERARDLGIQVVLPKRLVAAEGFSEEAPYRTVAAGELKDNEMALDVDSEDVEKMLQTLKSAKTILWNGPLGVFEWPHFRQGTMMMAKGLASLPARVIVGGGDSVAAVTQAGVKDQLAFISTGGGATLELLEGKRLPGVQALMEYPKG